MKKILLTKNQYAIVDDEDYLKMKNFEWQFSKGYAIRQLYIGIDKTKKGRNRYKYRTIFMHKEILNFENKQVDHINGNKLDNRRENLRSATQSQNDMNRKKRFFTTSIYKGVDYFKFLKKWRVRITLNGKQYNLGLFRNQIDAARAYDSKAKELFGKFARLNFA